MAKLTEPQNNYIGNLVFKCRRFAYIPSRLEQSIAYAKGGTLEKEAADELIKELQKILNTCNNKTHRRYAR